MKAEWTWNTKYQRLFDKVKLIIKDDACMKLYDEMKPLYLQTDASKVGLRESLLQTNDSISCHRDEVSNNNIL